MNPVEPPKLSENQCGHDPNNLNLSPLESQNNPKLNPLESQNNPQLCPSESQNNPNLNPSEARKLSGNRCGHDPDNPKLSPLDPIKKGLGAPPRILSLAAERLKEWFFNPKKCPELQSNPARQTRSERREAIQIVLEYLLSRLNLATMCVGTPTPNQGFVDVDMKNIVAGTGFWLKSTPM